jgi:hypothetical protein
MFMQYIPEWNQLKLSVCRIINDTKYPAYQVEPIVLDLGELFTSPVGVDNSTEKHWPSELNIFPNPSSGVARLRFTIHPSTSSGKADSQFTKIDLHSMDGREIRELANWKMPAGEHEIEIDISDLPCGVYFVRVQDGNEVAAAKLLVGH